MLFKKYFPPQFFLSLCLQSIQTVVFLWEVFCVFLQESPRPKLPANILLSPSVLAQTNWTLASSEKKKKFAKKTSNKVSQNKCFHSMRQLLPNIGLWSISGSARMITLTAGRIFHFPNIAIKFHAAGEAVVIWDSLKFSKRGRGQNCVLSWVFSCISGSRPNLLVCVVFWLGLKHSHEWIEQDLVIFSLWCDSSVLKSDNCFRAMKTDKSYPTTWRCTRRLGRKNHPRRWKNFTSLKIFSPFLDTCEKYEEWGLRLRPLCTWIQTKKKTHFTFRKIPTWNKAGLTASLESQFADRNFPH